jgi:hypothetical protein
MTPPALLAPSAEEDRHRWCPTGLGVVWIGTRPRPPTMTNVLSTEHLVGEQLEVDSGEQTVALVHRYAACAGASADIRASVSHSEISVVDMR